MRDNARTEVSFLHGLEEKNSGYQGHFPGYYTFLGHYFTSLSSKIVFYLNRIFVVWETGKTLESENTLYGSD